MKKIFNSKAIGLLILAFTICLNYAHALNDYGILKNNLYWKVLGQTSSSGGNGGSSGGNTPQKDCPPAGGCQAGGCGSSSCQLEDGDVIGTQKVSTSATSGYFACCYREWATLYARTYSQNDCCSR